jgi:hypothetical protein
MTLIDLQWLKLKLTFKQQNMHIFGISYYTKYHNDRETSNFDLIHMRIFNLPGLGAPDRPKKKKYTEINFISCYNFLRVRRDQFLPNCKIKPGADWVQKAFVAIGFI